MRVVSAIQVPLYLVWLVLVGFLTGQRLDDGDVARWVPQVLLPPAAVVFCWRPDGRGGPAWWRGRSSPLQRPRIAATLVFTVVAWVCRGWYRLPIRRCQSAC